MIQQIILTDGTLISVTEWQRMKGLPETQLTANFAVEELAEKLKLPVAERKLIIAEPLLALIQAFRDKLVRPVHINSGYRTEAHQEDLIAHNAGAAQHSPHCYGMAADIDTVSNKQTEQYVALMRQTAKELHLNIRIGWRQYEGLKETFLHVDVCPEYYAKGKPWHNKAHPWQWEKSIEW